MVELTQGGWGTQGVFGLLDHTSNAGRIVIPDSLTSVPLIKDAWLAARLADLAELSGLEVEYKVVSLYSRDDGIRTGTLGFALEHSSDSLSVPAVERAGHMRLRSESRARGATLEFDSLPAHNIRIDVREPDGRSGARHRDH